jgi:hypothetical protein
MKKTFKQYLEEQLVQPNSKNVQLPKNRTVYGFFNNSKGSPEGQYSFVKNDPTDPHAVIKNQKRPNVTDPFWIYTQELQSNPEMMDNPYLPKIYNHTKLRDAKDNTLNTAKIEKLHPIKSLHPEQILHIYHRAMGKEFEETSLGKEFLRANRFQPSDVVRDTLAIEALETLLGMLQYVVNGDANPNMIHDEDLKRALIFIERIRRKHKFSGDIHDDNIMVRLSSHGPQMVLTDPLWVDR